MAKAASGLSLKKTWSVPRRHGHGVDDRRHPEQQDDRDVGQVGHVPEEHRAGRQDEGEAQCEQQVKQEQRDQEDRGPVEPDSRDQKQRGQEHGQGQEQLGEPEEDGRDGEGLAREVDLPDQVAFPAIAWVEAIRELEKKFQGRRPARRKNA